MKKGIQNKMKAGAEKRLADELNSLAEWNMEGGGYSIAESAPAHDIEADVWEPLTEDEWYEAADSDKTPEYKKYSDSLVAEVIKKIEASMA